MADYKTKMSGVNQRGLLCAIMSKVIKGYLKLEGKRFRKL